MTGAAGNFPPFTHEQAAESAGLSCLHPLTSTYAALRQKEAELFLNFESRQLYLGKHRGSCRES